MWRNRERENSEGKETHLLMGFVLVKERERENNEGKYMDKSRTR